MLGKARSLFWDFFPQKSTGEKTDGQKLPFCKASWERGWEQERGARTE